MDYTTLWKRSCLTALLAATLRSAASAQDPNVAYGGYDVPPAGAPRPSARRGAGNESLWTDAPQAWGRPVAFRDANRGMKLTNAQDPATTGRSGPMGDMGNMGNMGQGDMGQTADPFDIGAAVNQQSVASGFDVGAALAAAPTSTGGRAETEAAAAASQQNGSATREAGVTDNAAADYTLGNQNDVRATSDAGDLLAKSGSTTNIVARSLNPVVNDARIRGYRYDQIRSSVNGAFFQAVRPDLDAAMSRLDSSFIYDVVAIKGPYSVRQGPGFAFVDIALRPTVRFEDGYQSQGQIASVYNTNGQQFSANTRLEGGSCDWGYRIGYAHRTGNDYDAGDGHDVAASYNVRNVEMQFSFDVNELSRIDVGYLRIDGTGIEIPSQVNDLSYTGTDAAFFRYVADDQEGIRVAFDAWYNRTRFQGTDANKPTLVALLGVDSVVTNGDVMSSGYRGLLTLGAVDEHQVTFGTDLTYGVQEYLEVDSAGAQFGAGTYGIPRVHTADPGIFTDGKLLLTDKTTARVGGRLDWASLKYSGNSNLFVDNGATNFPGDQLSYTLWASYIQLEHQINSEWTALAGFGLANRAPTATELFAYGPYLGMFQQGGLTYVNGGPGFNGFGTGVPLDQEYARQIDFSVKADYEDFRGGVGFFHSWIDDFITYQPLDGDINDPRFDTNYIARNNDVTLAGGDAYMEADVSDRLTLFGNIFYVEGRNQQFRVPLWGVPPLQSTLGFRLKGENWGTEFGSRIVAAQNRVNDGTGLNNISTAREIATPGFTTHYINGFYKVTEKFTLTAGVTNLGNKNYREHLDSTSDYNNFYPGGVYRPGRSFYFGANWSF